MTLKVKITFGDDKTEEFDCVDFPAVGDWITLYLKDLVRVTFNSKTVVRIETSIV